MPSDVCTNVPREREICRQIWTCKPADNDRAKFQPVGHRLPVLGGHNTEYRQCTRCPTLCHVYVAYWGVEIANINLTTVLTLSVNVADISGYIWAIPNYTSLAYLNLRGQWVAEPLILSPSGVSPSGEAVKVCHEFSVVRRLATTYE